MRGKGGGFTVSRFTEPAGAATLLLMAVTLPARRAAGVVRWAAWTPRRAVKVATEEEAAARAKDIADGRERTGSARGLRVSWVGTPGPRADAFFGGIRKDEKKERGLRKICYGPPSLLTF